MEFFHSRLIVAATGKVSREIAQTNLQVSDFANLFLQNLRQWSRDVVSTRDGNK
jgi:hypothetical protein